MQQDDRLLQGHRKRQAWLQLQIRLLKAGRLKSGDGEPLTSAVIRRAERQVADLDRAIARLRGKRPGSRTGSPSRGASASISRATQTRAAIMALLLVCGLLSGCGTNVRRLLTEQGELTPEADRLAMAAQDRGGGMEQPLYNAEDRQLAACRFLTDAVAEGMAQKPSFGQQFISDLSAVIVLLVPVEPVESCSDAVDAYRDSITQLEQQLAELDGRAGTRR